MDSDVREPDTPSQNGLPDVHSEYHNASSEPVTLSYYNGLIT